MAQGLMQHAAARQGRRDPRPSEIPSLDIYRRAKSFAQTDPVEAGLIGASMLPVPVVSDVAGFAGDVLGMIKRPEDRTVSNAGMAALGLLPFVPALGATIRASSGLKVDDLPKLLDELGYKYKVENSKFWSDRFGSSMSAYYRVDTPEGVKRFRVSDHPEPGYVDLRTSLMLGENADEQMLGVFQVLGRDAPKRVIDGAARSRAEKLAAQQEVLKAQEAQKLDQKRRQEDALNSFGAGHLTGRAKRQALAALHMRSEGKKRQAISEILARNPGPSGDADLRDNKK